MNKKEIEKMISLADDSYIEEMFTTRLYERKRHGTAWIAAVAAAAAIAVGAAGIAINSAESDKFVADLQDIITETETETDTSVLETSVTTVFRSVLADRRGYFKNEPDDTMEYYYHLLERDLDFTSDGPVYRFSQEYLEEITRFTPEYRESEFRFERKDFRFLEGGMQCAENGEPLYANIRLYNDDTENPPMVHMVFYSDESSFADFDKSLYTSHMYGDIELYGFDFSAEKDGSKLMACWRSGDTNYMFASRGLGVDNFLAVVGEYYETFRKGENGLMYVEDDFTLDSFDLTSEGSIRSMYCTKGGTEMNRNSVFAGYVPDYSPLAGLHLMEDTQNYDEAALNGEIIYRRYHELYIDPESYEIGNGSEKIYISLIYEWGEDPDTDTVSHAPIVSLEEITPEKLDEIKIDDEYFNEQYVFVIPVNDFTITVRASCEREQLLEAVAAIITCSKEGVDFSNPAVVQELFKLSGIKAITLDEANADTPFAGYVPQTSSIGGMNLSVVISETKDSDVLPKQNELRVMYRGAEIGRYTEYVHFYYYKDGTMPTMGTFGRKRTNNFGETMPVVETPEDLSVKALEDMAVGNGDLTKHSFYLNINKAEFYIRVEALCSSEKLMKFFEDMPDFRALQNSDEINSQTAVITTEPVDSDDDAVMYEGRKYYRSMLSKETLEWLDWYDSLSEEEQLSVSYEPQELSYLQYKF